MNGRSNCQSDMKKTRRHGLQTLGKERLLRNRKVSSQFFKDLLIISQALELREKLNAAFWVSARHLTSLMTSCWDKVEKNTGWMKFRWEDYQLGQ